MTTIWLGADSVTRRGITAASNYLDYMLRVNPLDVGEGREGIDRVVFQLPLVVVFEVHEDDRIVRIREVSLIA